MGGIECIGQPCWDQHGAAGPFGFAQLEADEYRLVVYASGFRTHERTEVSVVTEVLVRLTKSLNPRQKSLVEVWIHVQEFQSDSCSWFQLTNRSKCHYSLAFARKGQANLRANLWRPTGADKASTKREV